jgi:hypothetical protein
MVGTDAVHFRQMNGVACRLRHQEAAVEMNVQVTEDFVDRTAVFE